MSEPVELQSSFAGGAFIEAEQDGHPVVREIQLGDGSIMPSVEFGYGAEDDVAAMSAMGDVVASSQEDGRRSLRKWLAGTRLGRAAAATVTATTFLTGGIAALGASSAHADTVETLHADNSNSSIKSLPCTGVLLIGARGSGESYENDNDNSGTSGFGTTLSPVADALYDYYGGSSQITEYGLPYQASSVTSPPALGLLSRYENSVALGESMLTTIIEGQESACPDQTIDLEGYSQGAEVVADTVMSLSPDQRAALGGVTLFGDPKFNPTNHEDRGSFNHNLPGIYGGRGEMPQDVLSRVRSYCDGGDGICNYTLGNFIKIALGDSPHFRYMDTHAPAAAGFLEQQDQTDLVGGTA